MYLCYYFDRYLDIVEMDSDWNAVPLCHVEFLLSMPEIYICSEDSC